MKRLEIITYKYIPEIGDKIYRIYDPKPILDTKYYRFQEGIIKDIEDSVPPGEPMIVMDITFNDIHDKPNVETYHGYQTELDPVLVYTTGPNRQPGWEACWSNVVAHDEEGS